MSDTMRIEVCHHSEADSCVMLYSGETQIAHLILGRTLTVYPRELPISVYYDKNDKVEVTPNDIEVKPLMRITE